MIEIKLTAEDQSRVVEAENNYQQLIAEMSKLRLANPDISQALDNVRDIQIAQAALRSGFDDQIPTIILGIVEESNTLLPIAIEEGNQAGIESALGGILSDVCVICSRLQFDFLTIANGFNASNLIQPESDPLIALYKTVGVLACVAMHAMMENNPTTEKAIIAKIQFGYALSKVCSAVHWLAFTNDMYVEALLSQSLKASSKAVTSASVLSVQSGN